MIKKMVPLSMPEAQEYLKEKKELKAFLKNFNALTLNQAKELREKLVSLDIIKLNDKITSKIIDTLPTSKEELNKISSGMNFDEDETNKIINTIKDFK